MYLRDIILMSDEIGSPSVQRMKEKCYVILTKKIKRKNIRIRKENEIREKFPFECSFLKGFYLNHISILLFPYQLHKELHWEVCLFYYFARTFL